MSGKGVRVFEIARLAAADLLHEWRMSLCLILAVAAIATPLLLFFGLKHGTVDTLRKRLLDNPVTLEIIPVTEKLLDEAWFDAFRKNPLVAFVVPHTRKLSAQGDLKIAETPNPLRRVDLQPSLPGDILMERYGSPAPGPDQMVLTSRAATLVGAKIGDRLTLEVSRNQARVRATHDFTVAGILPPRANSLPCAYMHLEHLEYVEAFKDGRAVPAFGWPGSDPLAFPVYPSVVISVPAPLDATRKALILQNTGFARLEVLDAKALEAVLPGSGLGERFSFHYLAGTLGAPAETLNVSMLRDKLRGQGALIIPMAVHLRLISSDPRHPFELRLLPATALDASLPGQPLRDGIGPDFRAWSSPDAIPVLRAVLVSKALAAAFAGREVEAQAFVRDDTDEVLAAGRAVRFSLKLLPGENVSDGIALAPLSLLGNLNLLSQRPILNSSTEQGEAAFLLGRRGYSGFRMYATGLEQVSPLAEALAEAGITVNTKADRIDEVLNLNRHLGLLFWFIAAASLAGGMACLLASLYANVERKRRDLAVLRLLGAHGSGLAVFPLVSGVVLSICGLLLGLVLFHALAAGINILFSAQLEAGERFCVLTPLHHCAAVAMAAAMAVLAGILAARHCLAIDPAESLRDR